MAFFYYVESSMKPELPECFHRETTDTPGTFYCGSNRFIDTPGYVQEAQCLRLFNGEWKPCPYADVPNDPELDKPPEPPRDPAACTHRGKATGTQTCPTCSGTVKVKVFACPIHQQCTISKRIEGIACCAACPDYDSKKNDTA